MIKFNEYLGYKVFDHCFLESIDGVDGIRYGRDRFVVYALSDGQLWKTSLLYKDEEPEWTRHKFSEDLWYSLEDRDNALAFELEDRDFWDYLDEEDIDNSLVNDDIYKGYESDSRHNLSGYFNL